MKNKMMTAVQQLEAGSAAMTESTGQDSRRRDPQVPNKNGLASVPTKATRKDGPGGEALAVLAAQSATDEETSAMLEQSSEVVAAADEAVNALLNSDEAAVGLLPRELVGQHGVSAASDQELLRIVLRTGTAKCSTTVLAQLLLDRFQNLAFLAQASLAQLQEFPGIGRTKAIELQTAFELGRRSLRQRQLRQGVVISSGMIGQQMVEQLQGCRQEQLIVVYLDTKNQVIQERTIFTGSLNSSVAHPREIYHYAVLLAAARLIVVHNHPSGQLTPSRNDLEFSTRLVHCGELMGIQCLDHLIIGNDQYLSLREEKLLE